MTQLEDDRKTPEVQDGSRQGRRRLCLLKGCAAASARRRPAAGDNGRRTVIIAPVRRAKSDDVSSRAATGHALANVGPQKTPLGKVARAIPMPRRKFFFCQRPGCYEHVLPTTRSPRQRFCSWACRNALRRVAVRERRWRRRLRLPTLARCQRDDFW